MKRIAIIGGGLSGSLAAIQLLKSSAAEAVHVLLIEKKAAQQGRGVAYSSTLQYEPLNVPAFKMSLFADQPLHFWDWLQTHKTRYNGQLGEIHQKSFVSRRIFGDYLTQHLQEAIAQHPQQFTHLQDEATNVIPTKSGHYQIQLAQHATIEVDAVILALGNLEPASLGVSSPHFYQNPWADQFLQHWDKNSDILLLGTGLTMVDWAISLQKMGHKGKLIALSRRGFLPQPHLHPSQHFAPWTIQTLHKSYTFATFLEEFRHNVQEAAAQNMPWQLVLDAYREQTSQIWQQFSHSDKQTFLRLFKPYWEVHRHRMPLESQQQLQKMQESGQLEIVAGRIQSWQESPNGLIVTYKPKGSKELKTLEVAAALNCTGSNTDLSQSKLPLIQNLLQQGLAVADDLGLGFQTSPQGELLNAQHQVISNIKVLGTLRKATDWECTALNEIRKQVNQIVQSLQTTSASVSATV